MIWTNLCHWTLPVMLIYLDISTTSSRNSSVSLHAISHNPREMTSHADYIDPFQCRDWSKITITIWANNFLQLFMRSSTKSHNPSIDTYIYIYFITDVTVELPSQRNRKIVSILHFQRVFFNKNACIWSIRIIFVTCSAPNHFLNQHNQIKIQHFSKAELKMSSTKWRSFCSALHVLNCCTMCRGIKCTLAY